MYDDIHYKINIYHLFTITASVTRALTNIIVSVNQQGGCFCATVYNFTLTQKVECTIGYVAR